jgi:hypothetical protein
VRVETIHICGYCASASSLRAEHGAYEQVRHACSAFHVNFLKDKVENASFKSAASDLISFSLTFSHTVSFSISLHKTSGPNTLIYTQSSNCTCTPSAYSLCASWLSSNLHSLVSLETTYAPLKAPLPTKAQSIDRAMAVSWSSYMMPWRIAQNISNPIDIDLPGASIQELHQSPYAVQRTHNTCSSRCSLCHSAE